jgi:hypothetical protein
MNLKLGVAVPGPQLRFSFLFGVTVGYPLFIHQLLDCIDDCGQTASLFGLHALSFGGAVGWGLQSNEHEGA